MNVHANRWTTEQVQAVAPSVRAFAAAELLAVPTRWTNTGADDIALWGSHRGSGAEPYDVMVDHARLAWRCSCPSRQHPCKHALALLLLWVRGDVPSASASPEVARWAARHAAAPNVEDASNSAGVSAPTHATAGVPEHADGVGSPDADGDGREQSDVGPHDYDRDDQDRDDHDRDDHDRDGLDRARDERVARLLDGLRELERWLDDRMRTGLADPALARYETWDHLAARLVDARAGSLANRVRRLAGLVGSSPDWQSDVLTELGMLYLIASGGQRVPELPTGLADAVATASGWQVRQADVLAGAPITDDWLVAGRSDTREDRIEVRRLWLYGVNTQRWAMLLSFAAYQQQLDGSWRVGTLVNADLHFYPGNSMRALAGTRHADPLPLYAPPSPTVIEACSQIGRRIASEPWIERLGALVCAAPTIVAGRWVVSDATGSLPLSADFTARAILAAACAGGPQPLTIEWTPRGVVPLAIHLSDRTLDIGPVADASFATSTA